ncbi:hypothetical protein MM0343_08410 [Helicobacter pylori]
MVFKSYYIKAIELSQNTPIPLNKVTKTPCFKQFLWRYLVFLITIKQQDRKLDMGVISAEKYIKNNSVVGFPLFEKRCWFRG